MKKLVRMFLFIIMIFTMTSCGGKTNLNDAYDTFKDTISDAKTYKISGEMIVKRDSGEVTFDVCVLYQKPSNYKVSYQNKSNNSKQILLKNNDGVFVLIPELNKQFKFDSSWPLNSSHIYILETVLKDLEEDDSRKTYESEDYYVLESNVNHKLKQNLVCQRVYLSKEDYSLKKISYNTENEEVMTFNIKELDINISFSNQEFNYEAIMDSETSIMGEGSFEDVSSIVFGDVITNVSLVSQSVTLNTTVLTYGGEKTYYVVYSTVVDQEVSTLERIYNEVVFLDEGLGFVSTNCLTFYRNNKEFKIISQDLTLEEMVLVANSLQLA